MRTPVYSFFLLLVAGCATGKDSADSADTHSGNVDDTGDTAETGDTADTAETGDTAPPDVDADGYAADVDCDDADASIHPDAAELCNDVDDDCDTVVDDAPTDATTWYGDADGDGYGGTLSVTQCDAPSGFVAESGDCDDGDAAWHPGADETCEDTDDRNCDGSVGFADADNDGVPACLDCDDANPAARPGGAEVCDGADNDCDGSADNGALDAATWYTDADADGYGDDTLPTVACDPPVDAVASGGDCDDGDAAYHPGAAETCDVELDYNCDGNTGGEDGDADGAKACDDCDDTDATAFPGNVEACDGVDNDCNGDTDEAGADGESTWYADTDGDGYGDAASSALACDLPSGHTADATDCDDGNAAIHPAATEVCDTDDVDEDCDGASDDDDTSVDSGSEATWYLDYDGDGYGATRVSLAACEQPAGYVGSADDCNDLSASINPGATEVCDSADTDEDCDGDVDDDDASVTGLLTFYTDADGDGYGLAGTLVSQCDLAPNTSTNDDDCDDTDAAVSPAETEVCDAGDTDEDCNGVADDDDLSVGDTTFYADADGDTYGDAAIAVSLCDAAPSWVTDDQDCDDRESTTYPGAPETTGDGTDSDCDGGELCHVDADDDGYQPTVPGTVTSADDDCDDSGEALSSAGTDDCDDGDASVSPAGTETCNGTDDDCDGDTDEAVTTTYYADDDNDGYGDAADSTEACALPTGYAANDDDCDDTAASTHPAATETCNGDDDDCDGDTDEGLDQSWYVDADNDGYGEEGSTALVQCATPAGYTTNDLDCDDGDLDVNPGETEVCGDGVDNDCDPDPSVCSFSGTYAASTYDFRYTGTASSDYVGRSLALGDFDGDGDDDVAGGIGGYDSPVSGAGGAGILYGPLSTSGSVLTTAGALLTGSSASTSSYTGYAMSAGDTDGDGADELVVGAYGLTSSTGAAYVVYGGTVRSGATSVTSASDVATINGGTTSDYLGWALAADGDLDGDGLDEIAVGAYGQDGAASSAGAVYLFYGSSTRMSGAVNASTASATLRGVAATDYFGYSVAFVDDMDGDGRDELLAGAYLSDNPASTAGSAYLFLGESTPITGVFSASTADATWLGAVSGDYAGYSVSGVGDLDGDGYGDAGVQVQGYDGPSATISSAGGLRVYGGASTPPTTPVAIVYGNSASDYLGEDACSPGDLDGDGNDELLVGAYGQDTAASSAGAAYLFFGPVTGTLAASTADASFYGGTGGDGYFGRRLSDQPGDVTGDGTVDLVIGAYWDDSAVYDGGAIYVWEGMSGE